MNSADIAILAPYFSRKRLESWEKEFDNYKELIESKQEAKVQAILAKVAPLHPEEKFITFLDPLWPEILNQVEPGCSCLYYEGNLELLSSNTLLGVVGSRTVTQYGEKSLDLLIPLLQNGLVTISGLAYGIDTLVHKLALLHRSPTIAIIGGGIGLDTFYPKEHWSIRTQILERGGLILSEYPRGVQPRNYHFPLRNRLIAALSSKLFIVQASLKSGTLITAELALQLGKDIFTIPAELGNTHFEGNIKLLQNGAILISSSEDIAQFLNFSLKKTKVPTQTDSPILGLLDDKPLSVISLAEKLKKSVSEVLGELTMLEISREVRQDGQFWTRV